MSVPTEYLEFLRRKQKLLGTTRTIQVQNTITGLLPHQHEACHTIINWPLSGRALLADDMGLGKTVTALQIIAHYNLPALIICPSYLQTNWRCEAQRWLPHVDNITICSYEKCQHLRVTADVLICDEAHYIKERTSKRCHYVTRICHQTRRCLLLTGTPVPNRPIELWSLMHALRPASTPSWMVFARRYCGLKRDRCGHLSARGCVR